ncbi:MAG: peptidoglycan-binding domain-containing protein, partial [Fibrobacterota bacterium]
MERDTGAWDGLAKANFETVDIQQFLSDLHKACGWECDPGAVDGQAGPKTKAAIESFQRECNSRYKLGLKEDGVAGPKTWGAVLRVIHGQVQSALGQDQSKEPSWAKPKWGHGGKGVYANGEDFASGGDKPEERSVQITFFSQGSEPKLVDKTDAAATKTDNPVHDETKVVRQKVTKGEGAPKGAQEPIEDGQPFYNTTTDELFILPKDKVKDFDREWKMMETVMPIVGGYFFPDPSVPVEEAHWGLKSTFLFMKKLQEASSIDTAEKLAKNAKSEIEAGKAAVKQNPALAERLEVKGASMESGWYQKIYVADGKRMVWVRGERIRSHARWFNRAQTQARIRNEMESEAAEKKKDHTSKKPATSAEMKLFERDIFEPQKGTWAPALEEAFAKLGMQEMLKDSKHFQAGVAAQTMRWAAEGKYGATVNWTKDKTIKAEAKVEGSFSILSAQGHFDIYLTGKDGIDIVAQIKKIEPKLVRASAKPIKIQANLTFTGSAFTGICGSASAGLGLAFKEGKKKEAGMEVGIEAFAGAKVGAEAAMALKMQLFDEKNPNPGWKDLSSVTYGVWAAYGIGAEASFKVGYYDERFRIHARIGLVIKGGAGHYLKASVHAENIAQLIWTLGQSVNWNEMGKILGGQVWSYYQMIMWNSALTGKALSESAHLVSRELDTLMLASSKTALAGLTSVKGVDDTFDRYVPG